MENLLTGLGLLATLFQIYVGLGIVLLGAFVAWFVFLCWRIYKRWSAQEGRFLIHNAFGEAAWVK